MFDQRFHIALWGVVGAAVTALIGGIAGRFTQPHLQIVYAVVGAILGGVVTAIGSAWLRRKRPPAPPYAPKPGDRDFSPAHLLIAHEEVVEFTEFGDLRSLLGEFIAWIQDGEDIARILFGSGGVGKTRFSIELANRVGQLGMKTLFVPRGKEGTFAAESVTAGHRGLLIVDYAEGRPMLDTLITDVVKLGGWKILLLARSAGEWSEPMGRSDAVYKILDTARKTSHELKPLTAPEMRMMVQVAARDFARALGRPVLRNIDVPQSPTGSTVLEIEAAVLMAILDDEARGTDLYIDLQDVYRQTLRHEANYWTTVAQVVGLPPDTGIKRMESVAAAHALLGASSQEELDAIVCAIPNTEQHSFQWKRWITHLYPDNSSSSAQIPALAPDRLAEYLITEVLQPDSEGFQRLVSACSPGQLLNAVLVLARAHADGFTGAQVLLRTVIERAASVLPKLDAPMDLLEVIDAVLPQTQMSKPVARAVLGAVEDALHKSTPSAATRARLMGRYSTRASAAGETSLAVTYADQAVKTFRKLSAHNPRRYEAALASALNSLAIRLDEDDGDSTGAIAAAREALSIRERLAESDPRYVPDLAQALSTLAVRVSGEGYYSEAAALSSRCLALYQDTDSNLGNVNPRVARNLVNSALHLSQASRNSEALSIIGDGVALFEILAAADPATHRFQLSYAYMNQARIRYFLEDFRGAIRASDKAIDIRREYAQSFPEKFEDMLVRALNNHAVYQYRGDKIDEGVSTAEEAWAIALKWRGNESPAQLRAEAELCTTLANAYIHADRSEDALIPGRRAIEIFRSKATEQPGSGQLSLARALHNQAQRLQRVNRPCEGIPMCDEAILIRSSFARTDPAAHEISLSRSLELRDILQEECRSSD